MTSLRLILAQALAPRGYVVVPQEPIGWMLAAAPVDRIWARDIWLAMVEQRRP